MLNLAEYRRRSASLADWLPWAGLVAPGVVLNKDGSFQRTARFRGPDLESSTESELVAVTARLNNALRRLGTGWALFVEADRRAAAPYPASTFPDAVSWLVDQERRAAFDEIGELFESAYYLTLVFLPAPEGRARRRADARRARASVGGLARPAFRFRRGERPRERVARRLPARARVAR